MARLSYLQGRLRFVVGLMAAIGVGGWVPFAFHPVSSLRQGVLTLAAPQSAQEVRAVAAKRVPLRGFRAAPTHSSTLAFPEVKGIPCGLELQHVSVLKENASVLLPAAGHAALLVIHEEQVAQGPVNEIEPEV